MQLNKAEKKLKNLNADKIISISEHINQNKWQTESRRIFTKILWKKLIFSSKELIY